MVRKCFSKTAKMNGPCAWFGECVFQSGSNGNFFRTTHKTFAAATTLISESTHIIAFITSDISELRNIDTVGSSSEIIFILKSFNLTASASTQVMIHNIMSQFAAAAPQSVRPDVGR